MEADEPPWSVAGKLETQESCCVTPVWVWRPAGPKPKKSWCFNESLKAGKSHHPSSKAVRQEEFSLIQRRSAFLFYLHLIGWSPPTLAGGNLLSSCVLTEMLIPSRDTLTGTPSITFEQMSAPHGPVSWHIPLTSHHPVFFSQPHTRGFSCTDVRVLRPLHVLSPPPGMVSSNIRRNSVLGALLFLVILF